MIPKWMIIIIATFCMLLVSVLWHCWTEREAIIEWFKYLFKGDE